jgi:hypothetical protein
VKVSFDSFLFCLQSFCFYSGCSAAVLALKYGHIECANQITHRDWDEFFVIPRPLSIYETPPTTDDNQTTTTTITPTPKKKSKTTSYHPSPNKTQTRSSTLSFGLLRIIFNDSDTGYSTRLEGLCKQDRQFRHRQHLKHKKQEALQISTTTINKFDRAKSTLANSPHYCSTEALVNETQSPNMSKQHQTSFDNNVNLNNSNRASPRMQLLMQQHLSNKPNSKDNSSSSIQKTTSKTQLSIDDLQKTKSNFSKNDTEDIKSKTSIATMYRQTSHSTLNHSENNTSNKFQRPTTAIIHNQTFANPLPSRLSSAKVKPAHITSASSKKKALIIDRIDSAANIPKQRQSTIGSQTTSNSPTVYAGRPISSVMHHSPPRSNASACSIREATGTATRFNKPEDLFGLRPEDLFCPEEHQPKILDQRSISKADDHTRLKRHQLQKQQHIWQQDMDKIIELYNVHHCANYRKSAIQPRTTGTHGVSYTDTLTDLSQGSRPRRMSITKTSTTNSKPPPNPKQPTFTTLNVPRRNSISRPSIKLTNT